jgi:hypothetical protein
LSDRKVEIHKKVATLGSRSGAERLRLIGEVLSVLLASVQELADAEKQLPREHQRGIWQPLKLDDETHRQELNAMTYRTLEALHDRGCGSGASDEDVRRVMDWQFPMYSLEFTEIRVTEDAIQRERDAAFDYYV